MKKEAFCQYCIDSYRPVENMLKMVPPDKLNWKPEENFMSVGELIAHLCDGVGGELKMLVTNNWPAHPEGPMPSCSASEGLAKLEKDKAVLRELIAGISEEDFANREAATPWGASGTIEKMGFYFKEHFTNHKMQLFTYLKLLGLPVNTQTLYVG
ncbi:MAG: DinB family protein [Acidobacteriota bacterium]|jgi:uncharacterized damage-inducible protein DinB|nr:DinB family protein [Acidobacteriota bacterium]